MNRFSFLIFLIFLSSHLLAQSDSIVIKENQYRSGYSSNISWTTNSFDIDSFQNGKIHKRQQLRLNQNNGELKTSFYSTFSYDSIERLSEIISWVDNGNNINSTKSIFQYGQGGKISQFRYRLYNSSWVVDTFNFLIETFPGLNGKDSLITYYKYLNSDTVPFVRQFLSYGIYDSLESEFRQVFDTASGQWSTSLLQKYYNYHTPGGFIIIDTTDVYVYKKVYDFNGDYIFFGYSSQYDYDGSFSYTYDCNHQVKTAVQYSHYSSRYDTTVFDSSCRPDTTYHSDYNTSYADISRIIYRYPDSNNLYSFLSDSIEFCFGDTVRLNPILQGGTLPYHISWSPAAGLSSDTIADPVIFSSTEQDYMLTFSDANGNAFSRQVHVNPHTLPLANITIQSIDTINSCSSAILATDSLPGEHRTWYCNGKYFATDQSHFTAEQNGEYIYKASNNAGCENSDTIMLNSLLHTPPEITIATHCDKLIASAQSAVAFQWLESHDSLSGETNDTLFNFLSGNYQVIVVDSFNCTAISGFYFPSLFGVGHSIVKSCSDSCNGMITAIPHNGLAPFSYSWSTGDTGKQTPKIYVRVVIM